MRKHPLRAAVVALFVLAAALLCFAFLLPAQYSDTFLGILPNKMDRLQQSEGPRIIIVGGSSVPFSLKSGLVEEQLPGYTVVDFGLYADLGTPVMLDLLEEELQKGDIVIISPEQDPQALSDHFSAEALWQAADGRFDILKNLSSSRYEAMTAALPLFAGKKCGYALSQPPKPEDIYAKSSFDSYCDISSPLRSANVIPGGFDPNQMISFDEESLSEEFVQILNDFAQKALSQGVSVYYRFPPMNAAALGPGAEDQLDEYYDHLRQKISFPIMGDPHRSIMESGWFYDTNFHLNESGATVFTKLLIEDLKILLKDSSQTNIALPPMPELSIPGIIQGDDSCAPLFTYTQAEGGWIISGLTDEGKRSIELILPVSWKGQRVIGMDPTLFEGGTALQTLTVQENIGILYDGMFSGCTGLRTLILTGKNPGSYTVGDDLRTGADFLIQVPEESLNRYRRHYTWQKYADYLICE